MVARGDAAASASSAAAASAVAAVAPGAGGGGEGKNPGAAVAWASSAAAVAPGAGKGGEGEPGADAAAASSVLSSPDGRHAPQRLVKRLKKANLERELTESEMVALARAKVEYNKMRKERRARR